MRIATITSVAVLSLSSAVLATGLIGSPIQSANNIAAADNMAGNNLTATDDMMADTMSNDISEAPDSTIEIK